MTLAKSVIAICAAISSAALLSQPASALNASSSVSGDAGSGASGPMQAVQGMIFGADDKTIVIRTFDGRYETLSVSGPVTVTRTSIGTLSAAQAGSNVLSASVVDKSGKVTSQEIIITPSTPQPAGAASPIWLDVPATQLDGGVVGATPADGASTLQLNQTGSVKSIAVAPKARVLFVNYASLSDLQRNIRVRALATQNINGILTAQLVDIRQ